MSDTPNAWGLVLDRLDENLAETKECRAELGELRLEVRTTTASDADCLARAAAERARTDDSVKRLWGDEGVGGLDRRVAKLERGAWLRGGLVRILLPVATGVVLALLGVYLRGCA